MFLWFFDGVGMNRKWSPVWSCVAVVWVVVGMAGCASDEKRRYGVVKADAERVGLKVKGKRGWRDGRWAVRPEYERISFPNGFATEHAHALKPGGQWVYLSVPSGRETPFVGDQFGDAGRPLYARRFAWSHDGQSKTMEVTLFDGVGRPSATLRGVQATGTYDGEWRRHWRAVEPLPGKAGRGWVVRHRDASGEPYDVVYSEAGGAVSPRLTEVVRFLGFTASSDDRWHVPAIRLDPSGEVNSYWPLVLDGGAVLKVPTDCVGAVPLLWDGNKSVVLGINKVGPNPTYRANWLVGWAVGWHTPVGVRWAIVPHADPSAEELLLSATGAIYSDVGVPKTGNVYRVRQYGYWDGRWGYSTHIESFLEYSARQADTGWWVTMQHPGNRLPTLLGSLTGLSAATLKEMEALRLERERAVYRRAVTDYEAYAARQQQIEAERVARRARIAEANRLRVEETTGFAAAYARLIEAGDLTGARDLIERRDARQRRIAFDRLMAEQEARVAAESRQRQAREARRLARDAQRRAEYDEAVRKGREKWDRWRDENRTRFFRGEQSFYWDWQD